MRYFQIDFLRAVSILGMIAIHVFAYRQFSDLDTGIWNWLNFVVVGFVFCSGYVLYGRYRDVFVKKNLLAWYKKRIIRLLAPYYIFLSIFVLLSFTLPSIFSGFDLKHQAKFIIESIFMTSGLGLSWLPLLFVQLTLLFPILSHFWVRRRKLLYVYGAISLMSACYFTIYNFPYEYYRLVMWLPWSLILILSFYVFDRDEKESASRNYLILSIIFGLAFLLLYSSWSIFDKSYFLTKNKYPPNLYFILYATFGSVLTLLLSYLKVFKKETLKRFILFTSRESYSLFFVHYIVLDFALTTDLFFDIYNPYILTLVVTALSIFLVYMYTKYKIIFLDKIRKK